MKQSILLVLLALVCSSLISCGKTLDHSLFDKPDLVQVEKEVLVTGDRFGSCYRTSSMDNDPWPRNSCYFPGGGLLYYEGSYRISVTSGSGAEIRFYDYDTGAEFRYCNLNPGDSCVSGPAYNWMKSFVRVWPKDLWGTTYLKVSVWH